jgi:hypothetical protein
MPGSFRIGLLLALAYGADMYFFNGAHLHAVVAYLATFASHH